MDRGENPSSVPISPVRDATLAYIVIIAPIAPIEDTEIVVSWLMNFDRPTGRRRSTSRFVD